MIPESNLKENYNSKQCIGNSINVHCDCMFVLMDQ